MEWLKRLSLKKSLSVLVFLFLLGGLLLGFLSYQFCSAVIDYNEYYSIQEVTEQTAQGFVTKNIVAIHQPYYWIWSFLQLFLPVVCIVGSLITSNIIFFRMKLKKPLAILQSGAEKISQQNLDFTIEKNADDELGELCTAFETMRAELDKSNRELWRQMEERKRLNDAFSHDLRNPVTVLKGSAKILQRELEQGDLTAENAGETLSLITQYVGRIETYIEAMSSAQKLEEVQYEPKLNDWSVLANELKNSLSILGANENKEIEFLYNDEEKQISVDKHIIQNTAENLISNALRYAKDRVSINLCCDDDKVTLTIQDDGGGFSNTIIRQGAVPFLRDSNTTEQGVHFGMVLYICRLLCEKHRGTLTLENTTDGAKVTATFFF